MSYINDSLGRRKALFIGAVVGTFGCVLQAGAAHLGMLIAGRIVAGFSIGILTSTIPMYCSEIAPAQHRGALAGLLQWMLSWGFLVAQWLGYGCTFADSHFQCTYSDDVIIYQPWLIYHRAFSTGLPMSSCSHSCPRCSLSEGITSLAR